MYWYCVKQAYLGRHTVHSTENRNGGDGRRVREAGHIAGANRVLGRRRIASARGEVFLFMSDKVCWIALRLRVINNSVSRP